MNKTKILLRAATMSDLPAMLQLFTDTIFAVCKDDYSPEQIKAWSSSVEQAQVWQEKISAQYFLIAALERKIVGYASLENNKHVDLLYVHKDYQRQGIADKLYSELEKEAVRRNATAIHSFVSKTAKPFFEKNKFKLIEEQKNIRQGIEIINYKMSKEL